MPKPFKFFPKLTADLKVDVAIIGGGMAGISSAYMLAQSGKKVAVLEGKTIGSGATAKTTAFITQVIDTSIVDLVSMFGASKARQVWESHGEAINTIERISQKEKIDCNFIRCPYYQYAINQSQLSSLQEEQAALGKLGVRTKLAKDKKLAFPNSGYLEIPNQAKFSAEDYLHALADCAEKKGAEIFENTEVSKISGTKIFRMSSNGRTITAGQVIIATYDPLGNPKPTHFKKGMYTSYVFNLRVPKGSLPQALYQDMNNPYHYLRVDPGKNFDIITIGGEDSRAELKMNPQKNYTALTQYIKKTFPGLQYQIMGRWNGPILEPTDGLPLIGQFAPNQYVATAFSGNGMTYSMLSALIFSSLLSGKKSPWVKLYDPNRTPSLKQLGTKFIDYAGEFVGGAVKNAFK